MQKNVDYKSCCGGTGGLFALHYILNNYSSIEVYTNRLGISHMMFVAYLISVTTTLIRF